ncbi:unnamed protein product [Echinostoma caproni]|uniref:PH domain-containing protein n=1 Tax=Echinostoma caproni TaxID=27848 RepID=A0A183B0E5_9TREM|nr:unnamed protein product [Echinostoma caproni]
MSEFSSPAKEFARLFGPFAEVWGKAGDRVTVLKDPTAHGSGKIRTYRRFRRLGITGTTLCSQAAVNISGRCGDQFVIEGTYKLVMYFDLPDDVDTLVVTLRRQLAGPKTALEYQEEFYMRQQRPEESLMDYMGSVRRLARLAYSTYAVEERNAHVLDRFLAGLREPRAKDE